MVYRTSRALDAAGCLSQSSPRSLILLQWQQVLLDAILRDDQHLQPITNLNVPLDRTIKGILDQHLHILPPQRLLLPLLQRMALTTARHVLVLEVDLVVQERHDQAGSGARGAAHLALVAADGVVAVDGALAVLVEAAEDGVRVVGEEALAVENGGQALGAGVDAHGLAVAVAVHLAHGVELLLERLAVGREAAHGEHERRVGLVRGAAANLEHLGVVACVDAVAGGVAGVAGHDGEVVACDGENGAAVVGVSGGRRGLVFGTAVAAVASHSSVYLRVEAVLPEAIVGGFGGVVEGVVGSVHDGVLAKHGSHLCGCGGLRWTERWCDCVERGREAACSEEYGWFVVESLSGWRGGSCNAGNGRQHCR